MELPKAAFDLFDRDVFTFKQLKEQVTDEEIQQIKTEYQKQWQKWKQLQLAVADRLPVELTLNKPKIESWTNGWNLRNHFWCAYRSTEHPHQNACLAVLQNKKQFQVYLMFQHYRSEKRQGTITEYNQLLEGLPAWGQTIDPSDYYIWPQQEPELSDHLPLKRYFADPTQQAHLKKQLAGRTFQIGKLCYRDASVEDLVQWTVTALTELAPLYLALMEKRGEKAGN